MGIDKKRAHSEDEGSGNADTTPPHSQPHPTLHSRRDVVRQGIKLAFVAPLVSTFFARDAHAAASGNASCYEQGEKTFAADPTCGNEPCCTGLTCQDIDAGGPGTDYDCLP